MTAFRRLISTAALGLGLWLGSSVLAPTEASAIIVEKIVAIVGDDAILLTDLRVRGAPFQRQILRQFPAGPQRAAAESQMFKELIVDIVEETLEQQAAERTKTVVEPAELDKAFQQLAAGQRLTVDELFELTEQKTGLTEVEYRAEIRRQILEGKLLSQRVRGRIRITEEDLKNTFRRTVREERELRQYRPAWITLRILPTATPAQIEEQEKLAGQLHARILAGDEFAKLAIDYSDDTSTRDKGGDLGIKASSKSPAVQAGKRTALAPELEEKILPLEPNEVTQVFRAGDAFVIMKLLSREPSKYTTFEEAREEMVQRVQAEILAREKATWLEELKKRTYVKWSL